MSDRVRRTLRVTGQVQGVGFRPFVYRLARALGVCGTVCNDQRGVTIDATAAPDVLDELARRVRDDAPALARVDGVTCLAEAGADASIATFSITASDLETTERGRVTVDAAVCVDCLREMLDPADRRYRHALINCTNCGPRYSIIRDLPYDRPRTTMANFDMCPPCAAEYADPADRRFHAQPTCCPGCGPVLRLVTPDDHVLPGDPIRTAAQRLASGAIVAIKGIGGYHLAVLATDDDAVARLRAAKHRDAKPFALMVESVEAARRLVDLSPSAAAALRSPVAPIVLAPRRATGGPPLAADVAPGCHRLGVMVPYTPIQHLLFAEPTLRGAVLVMTSANLSDDPLISDDGEALARLATMCDALLAHDRPIERAVDDSIFIDGPRGPLPLRCARGMTPSPLHLPRPVVPGLCTGGELKNAIGVARGEELVLGQHVGDLTHTLAFERFRATIDDLQRLFDVQPEWIAYDAHPGYTSHAFARRLARERGVEAIPVQHHHAHLASLLAEHDRTDRVIGLVCDGVGYGLDGTAWGGEILVGDLAEFERAGRMRPLRLPGGDAAAKQTGRCALSWIHDALGADACAGAPGARALRDERTLGFVAHMLGRDLNCPPSSGMGRLFDAAAALLGVCDYNHHEAMSGMLLEATASAAGTRVAGDGLVELDDDGELLELDHRPLCARLLDGVEAGEPVSALAWGFHDAIADALARAARAVSERTGVATVGLTGGVFCNTLLTELVATRLESAGLEVLVHRVVPPNDGGLAYGQAAAVAAVLG